MSKHDWKPGDVALWDIDGQVDILFFCNTGPRFDEPKWQTADSGEGWPSESNLRRAVVIDPENAEQVDALCKALVSQMWHVGDTASAANGVHPATVASALRSLIRPPKPAEPTGLGAVVEDADGSLLVRIIDDLKPWTCHGGPRWSWDDVDAIRILSEGVEVDR